MGGCTVWSGRRRTQLARDTSRGECLRGGSSVETQLSWDIASQRSAEPSSSGLSGVDA